MNADRDTQAIEREAAAWLARREGGLSAREAGELAKWLKADVRHARAMLALGRSWDRLDKLRGSAAAGRLEAELAGMPSRGGQGGKDAAAKATAEEAGYPLRRRGNVRVLPWVSGALAASVVWAAAYLAWWRPLQVHGPFADTVATEIGAVRTMALPDGSVVRLNTDTAIEVLFTKVERRVRLGRGEAFFTVAKNPARPFVVTAAGIEVRAVGTEFNVRIHQEALEVIVREGKVRVEDALNGASLLAARAWSIGAAMENAKKEKARETREILTAGHRVTIPVGSAPKPLTAAVAPVAVDRVEIERSLAWHAERLVFESAPLATIVAEFNRYNRRPLVVADAELAARRFGGTFEANDTRTFLELLRATEGIVTEERAGETVLRQGPR